MDNLAYLHLAYEYDVPASLKPVKSNCNRATGSGLNWKQLSSWAWRYLLPLALNLAILSIATHALALQRGDTGSEVTALQEQLKAAGFFNANPTELYGSITEDAVRRFQEANGLEVDGVAGPETISKLQNYRRPENNPPQSNRPGNNPPQNTPKDTNSLRRGGSGEEVRVLQQQLSAAGFFTVNPTGVFGPITEDAVRRFQAANNIIANGIVGTATQRQLQKYAIGGETPPSNYSSRDILRRGDSGDDVKALQEQLRQAKLFNAEPTGNFGPLTEDGVRRFQEANYLAASGIAGPTTRRALQAYLANASRKLVSTASSNNTLRLGDRGSNVRVLQEQLRRTGFFNGSPTGTFDENTEDSVRQFQAANYLAASGIAGPTTRGKLQELVNGSTSTASTSLFSVFTLQQRLQKQGFYDGPIDGDFGPVTRAAIVNAQRFYGITESDIRSGRF